MVSVDREDWDRDVEVVVFVVDRREAKRARSMNEDQMTKKDASSKGEREESHSRVSVRSPFIRIAEQLDLNGFVSVRELSKHGHGLMDGVSTWVVVVEEVTGEKNEVDLREEGGEGGER